MTEDLTGGEVLILWSGAGVIVLGLMMLWASKPARRRVEPSMLPSAPLVSALPPALTVEEAAAVEQARALGQPVEFYQPHLATGHLALFRATPMGDGRALISVAQASAQLPTVPSPPPPLTKWVP